MPLCQGDCRAYSTGPVQPGPSTQGWLPLNWLYLSYPPTPLISTSSPQSWDTSDPIHSGPLPPHHLLQEAFPDTPMVTLASATQSHAPRVVSSHGLPGTWDLERMLVWASPSLPVDPNLQILAFDPIPPHPRPDPHYCDQTSLDCPAGPHSPQGHYHSLFSLSETPRQLDHH